ncbi:SsgA family sporulation/cell division regulator [Streptomyces sp. NPDC054842]
MSAYISVSLRQTDPIPYTYLAHRAVLVSDDRPPHSLGITLQYSAEQPLTVLLTLHASGENVHWHLSREQLIAGLRRHEGCGDVAVWPSARRQGEGVVCVRLGPPRAGVVVEICRVTLSSWLRETLRLIPRESESDYLSIDQAIAGLLASDS